jgi:beta-alanine degradation protein BauB
MALTVLDKTTDRADTSAWPAAIAAEFEREGKNNNACVGSTLLSENEKVRVWIIRLAPGERIGFHRHVLDYFWTSVSGGRGRQHIHDGTTVEYSYQPRRGTRPMGRANSRSTTSKISATRKWSS